MEMIKLKKKFDFSAHANVCIGWDLVFFVYCLYLFFLRLVLYQNFQNKSAKTFQNKLVKTCLSINDCIFVSWKVCKNLNLETWETWSIFIIDKDKLEKHEMKTLLNLKLNINP